MHIEKKECKTESKIPLHTCRPLRDDASQGTFFEAHGNIADDISSTIKNRSELLSHGDRELREAALDIVEYALNEANPYKKVKELVKLKGDTLWVGENKFDLNIHKRIYVLGAGKATFPMAKALDEILGSRVTDGVVICKHGQSGTLDNCRLRFGGHPIPDESGHAAAKETMEIIKQTKENDIVFSITTGGSTAMMPYPVEGVTLEDKRKTGELLLRSGATMWEMNYVRSHLTQIKAGLMGKIIHPKAVIINLGVADGIGQGVDDCVDTTTACFCSFDDARNVLSKYDLWDKVPQSVSQYIKNGTEDQEIPRDLDDHILYNYLLVEVNDAVEAAYDKAMEMGFNTMILSTFIEGDSRELGDFLGSVGMEIKYNGRPLKTPAAVIIGGESMQKINIPDPGEGGPSQQLSLSAATKLKDHPGIVLCGIDTDGTDGPTDLAGGLVDSTTMQRAEEKNLDLYRYMDEFNDSVALRALGDAIRTGATGTNVNDLRVLLVR